SSDGFYTVHPGDRIAQLAVVPLVRAELECCDDLDATGRGEGGFGSTGN
ncbi:MAG: dUTP diphosphatase, partial [Pseudoflavonifractor sp.]